MGKISYYYFLATKKLAQVFLVAIIFLIGLQVIARFFKISQLGFTIELITLFIVFTTAFAIPLINPWKQMLKIDLLKFKNKYLLKIILFLLGLFLISTSFKLTLQFWHQKTPLLKLPLGLAYVSFNWTGIGFILFSLKHDS